MDDQLFNRAASEAFPEYNVKNIISLELPDFSGQVYIPGDTFGYIDHMHAQLWAYGPHQLWTGV